MNRPPRVILMGKWITKVHQQPVTQMSRNVAIKAPANSGLPARWRYRHGAYTYRVPPGQESVWDGKKEFRLGATQAEAYAEWSRRIGAQDRALTTMEKVFDRYLLEITPNKKAATQKDEQGSIARLRKVFGHYRPDQVTADDALAFYDARIRRGGGRTAPKHDVGVLRHVLTCCVRPWRILSLNPLIGQIKLPNAYSSRVVEDWEVAQIMTLPLDDQMRAYCEVKILTGLRRYDMLH